MSMRTDSYPMTTGHSTHAFYANASNAVPGQTNQSGHAVQTEANIHYHIARIIATYFVPFICALGIVCNTLATITFLKSELRKFSCSIYLIVRSVSDTLFLLTLITIYIGGVFDYDINTIRGVCQTLVFLTYMSGFISVWAVILVTCENYIRIRYPFKVKTLCTPQHAYISIGIMVIITMCIYHFPLWVCDKNCQPKREYNQITHAIVFVDTVLTLGIPTVMLAFLIVAIIIKILETHDKRDSMTITTLNSRLVKKQRRSSNGQKMAAVTRMLLAVSLTFFVLTVPSHIVRIKLLISSFVRGILVTSNTEAAVQGIAQQLYYASMAVNLFIYLSFGENFRRVFKDTFCGSLCCKPVQTEIENRHVTPFRVQTTVSYCDTESECVDESIRLVNMTSAKCIRV